MSYVMNWIWVLCLCLLAGTTAGQRGSWKIHGNNEYYVSPNGTSLTSYTDAQTACGGLNGVLAYLKTDKIQQFVQQLVSGNEDSSSKTPTSPFAYYIGLKYNNQTNAWTWNDGELLNVNFTNWSTTGSSSNNNGDCVIIGSVITYNHSLPWYNVTCDGSFAGKSKPGYVCQRQISTEAANTTSPMDEGNKTTERIRTSNTTTASISITTSDQQNKISTTAINNNSVNSVAIAVPVGICFLILITIAVIVIVWYWKRKRKESSDETTRRNGDSGDRDLQIHALPAASSRQRNETTASSSQTTNGGKQKTKQDKGPLHRGVPSLQIPAYQNINRSDVTLSTNLSVEDDPVNSSQGNYENCMGREVIPDIKYQDLDDLHRRGQKTFGSRKYENIQSSHTDPDILYDDGTYENPETIQQVATNVRTRHDNASDTDSDDNYIKPPQYYGPKKNYNSNDSDDDDYETPIQFFSR